MALAGYWKACNSKQACGYNMRGGRHANCRPPLLVNQGCAVFPTQPMTPSAHHDLQARAFVHQHLLDDAPEQRPVDVVEPMFLQSAEKRRPLLLAVGIEQPVRAGREQRGRRGGMLRLGRRRRAEDLEVGGGRLPEGVALVGRELRRRRDAGLRPPVGLMLMPI